MKRYLLTVLFFLSSFILFAQLQSPEQFMGYPIGTRFTPHWRIVEYAKYIAANNPNMVKMQQYGVTNEGRPLYVLYVSNATNISNLENIRTSNLRMANGESGTANQPVIVWLSYNVHGNEAASSEAFLMALYSLVDPNESRTKQWLQNTLVIMDPCINPDGRDRYINWYNSVVGKSFNPSPEAREHREPWPGGRTNHYNFDLNRDWAWQTQVETQQRLKLYNEWLPQIHVDYHEQGINAPYYFAPAAEPFHEVITKWQRDFQNTIGRNHARYFDANGWLYFTKERFDLLYPSYGDTYPLYNGAIGMTYEQGGIGGGLGVLLSDGDTLTLVKRALHHYTTSMSTLEVASQNASKLLSEFQSFYKNSINNGSGNYKAYVVKTNGNAGNIVALKQLLDRNHIQYYTGKAANLRGFSYESGKDEGFTLSDRDLVVPTTQQKGVLAKVLFEPQTALSDSATYDITAWSLPYSYGLKAYGVNERIARAGNFELPSITAPANGDVYGYVLRWDNLQSAKVAAQLMQKGVRLRVSDMPFTSGGQSFDRGALIILKTANQQVPDLWSTVRRVAADNSVALTPVTTGFVDKGIDFGGSSVRPLKNKRVAMLTGEGVSANAAGEVWFFFEQELNYPITLINANDAGRVDLRQYDVLIMPDGNYRFMGDKAFTEQLHNWVNQGGNIIALENSTAQLSKLDWIDMKLKKEDTASDKSPYNALRRFEDRERDAITGTTPGSIFRVELDNTHPLAFGYPNHYYTLKQDDNIYEFVKDGGWNVGVLKKNKQVAGFVGSKLQKRLMDGLLFGVQDEGRGSVVFLTDDPLFRNFWQNGKLLFYNAVFLVGN